MPDIRSLAADLLANPLLPAPPIGDVAARARQYRGQRTRRRAAIPLTLLLLVASMHVVSESKANPQLASENGRGPGAGAGALADAPVAESDDNQAGGAGSTPPAKKAHRSAASSTSARQCASGRNGGATDQGVTGDSIKVFVPMPRRPPSLPPKLIKDTVKRSTSSTSTVLPPVTTSTLLPSPSFFAPSPASTVHHARDVVASVIDRVNRAGGICGRRIEVRFRDGYSSPPKDTFAAIVGPTLPGLDGEIRSGLADRARVPVIGTDGLDDTHFRSPWVWPVVPPPASMARIALQEAYDSGARSFALVYDDYINDPSGFGENVKVAFESFVDSLPGDTRKVEQEANAKHAVSSFNRACVSAGCDFVLLALPASGVTAWLRAAPVPARLRTAGLTFEVATAAAACDSAKISGVTDPCANLYVWDPFTPPIPDFADDTSVRAYGEVAVDVNPFVEGAYVGAELLVEAIQAVGPNLTRDRLKAALDRITYRSPLVGGLSWDHGDPGRIGNRSARALRYEHGALVDAGTGWVTDPWSGPGRLPG